MPRKKSEHCRLAILRACLKVLDEKGYLDLTIEEVASKAQAGKQTVYRHFGSKARLALEAFTHITDQAVPEDTGSLGADLQSFLHERIERVDFPKKRQMVSGLLAEAQCDPDFAACFRQTYVKAHRRPVRTIFRRAIARGEVDPEANIELFVDLLFGPWLYRLLATGDSIDPQFATELSFAVAHAATLTAPPLARPHRDEDVATPRRVMRS
ncbi:MAG: TetR/AcrR family transcriptional regulator [Myxococcota bacterium]